MKNASLARHWQQWLLTHWMWEPLQWLLKNCSLFFSSVWRRFVYLLLRWPEFFPVLGTLQSWLRYLLVLAFFLSFLFSCHTFPSLVCSKVRLSTGAFLVAQMVKNLPSRQETQVQSLGWEDPLEEEMATHSRILAWRIPWTEEHGGLHSMELQNVRHDWATIAHSLGYLLQLFAQSPQLKLTVEGMFCGSFKPLFTEIPSALWNLNVITYCYDLFFINLHSALVINLTSYIF